MVAGYRIDKLLSRGGMGVVYCATNLALGRRYALKVLAPELAHDPKFLERFRREIRLAASLRHPHAVEVHYAGELGDQPFLAMDFVEGTNLREVIMQDGQLEPERAVRLLRQVAGALDAAHRLGLVHRDIKPGNVLIDDQGGAEHAYLSDFGLAKRLETTSDLTAFGVVVGTVDYMSPEQIKGGRIDARTDVYALGCTFFHMLAGKVPFERDTTAATMWAQVYDTQPSLLTLRENVHPAFDAVIVKAMAKHPDDRYLSAGDLGRDAAAALQGSRYHGPPTAVATGDATPRTASPEARAPGTGSSYPMPPTRIGGDEEADPETAVAAGEVHTGASAMHPQSVARDLGEPAPSPMSIGDPPPGASQTAGTGSGPRRSAFRWLGRHRLAVLCGLLLVGGAIAAVALLGFGSPKPVPPSEPAGDRFASGLAPVPTNHVTGGGFAEIRLNGNVARITIDATGLVGEAHLMHIHAGARGICPPASAARLHNRHRAISAADGGPFYGQPRTSLTETGDTTRASIVDFARFPVGSDITYRRTFTLGARVTRWVRKSNAVIAVHGIDYDHDGKYTDVLDKSELAPGHTGESTAPALCGALRPRPEAYADRTDVYTAILRGETPAGTWLCHLGQHVRATRATL